jgi:hypothetical protein
MADNKNTTDNSKQKKLTIYITKVHQFSEMAGYVFIFSKWQDMFSSFVISD